MLTELAAFANLQHLELRFSELKKMIIIKIYAKPMICIHKHNVSDGSFWSVYLDSLWPH